MKKHWFLTLALVLASHFPSAWAADENEFPRDVHGLWWQPADPGWATAVFDHEGAMSSILMVYDRDGSSIWFATPNLGCTRNQPPFLIVNCDGPMYRVEGPWFGESSFDPDRVSVTEVGEWTGSFRVPLFGGVGPTQLRWLFVGYTIEGTTVLGEGNKPMEIQVIDPKSDLLYLDGRYTGLWWQPSESGWGIGLYQQGNSLYATLFVHGQDRRPRWYVIDAKGSEFDQTPDRLFEGAVYETRGHPWGLQDARPVEVRRVGSASIKFGLEKGDPATLNYSIDGVEVSKTIYRSP